MFTHAARSVDPGSVFYFSSVKQSHQSSRSCFLLSSSLVPPCGDTDFCSPARRAVWESLVFHELWITASCHLLRADYKYDSVSPQGKHINLDFDLHLFWCWYWHNSRPRCLISAGSSDELICISWNTLWEGDCVGHSNSSHWNTDRNITSFYLYQSRGFQNTGGWRQVSGMSSREGLNRSQRHLLFQFVHTISLKDVKRVKRPLLP